MGNRGLLVWSPIETEVELTALRALMERPQFSVHLFNELAVNVASCEVVFPLTLECVSPWLEDALEADAAEDDISSWAGNVLDGVATSPALQTDSKFVTSLQPVEPWSGLQSFYVTNRLSPSDINLFSPDEGRGQEQLGLWLTDDLQPEGAAISPNLEEPSGIRELTDILLTYQGGSVLIESKTLNISARGIYLAGPNWLAHLRAMLLRL